MRDGWTGKDPYPEDGDGGAQFRRDLPALIALAKEIVLTPAADASKYTPLSRALANGLSYCAELLKQHGIVL